MCVPYNSPNVHRGILDQKFVSNKALYSTGLLKAVTIEYYWR